MAYSISEIYAPLYDTKQDFIENNSLSETSVYKGLTGLPQDPRVMLAGPIENGSAALIAATVGAARFMWSAGARLFTKVHIK